MTPAAAAPDFRRLFESAPNLYLVLDADLRIVAVSDAYADATMTRRHDIVGKGIFEVFPDNPDDPGAEGVRHLKGSLQRVLRERRADAMPVQKYDVRKPGDVEAFEERFWSPLNSPVLDGEGKVEYIIHRVEDVTDYVRERNKGAEQLHLTETLRDRTAQMEREIYARAREVSEARDSLEQRVAERTAALNDANRTLKDARRAALNIAEDAILARQRAEQALARNETLLEHLRLLDEITRAVGERLDLPSIFQVVVRSLEDDLPLDFACICLQEPDPAVLKVAHVGVRHKELLDHMVITENSLIPVESDGLSRCLEGHLVYKPDLSMPGTAFSRRLMAGGLVAAVLAPLRSESRALGMLVCARRERDAFTSSECEFLRQLSEHIALAVHQGQLYAALQQAYDDLRLSQQTVMQQERLRSLGQMASGIAHDINNALSPVSLYTESLLETEKNLSDKARGYLETIQRAVDDVAHTVARMREFYRQRETQLELSAVDLNRLVQQVVDLSRARWHDMPQQRGFVIDMRVDLSADLVPVMGVESEIREALLNLVFNAVDAMPEGGTMQLRTSMATGETGQPAALVEIVDSGVGMDEDTRQRCLEPFFTTKGERGTGLGLAMVFGIVQRHSAELEIDSAPGAGSTFRLVFAVPVQSVEDERAAGESPARLSRLRLLLVDDDPILLKSLRDALESDGHVVVTANGGEAGIAACGEALRRREPYAAVITDLGMPYVDGRRVAAAVKDMSSETPVIMLTGWGQRLVAEGDIPPQVDVVLAKPPKLREIRDALTRLCQPGPGVNGAS